MKLRELLEVLDGQLEIAIYRGDKLIETLNPMNVFKYENDEVIKTQIWRPDDTKTCRVNITVLDAKLIEAIDAIGNSAKTLADNMKKVKSNDL